MTREDCAELVKGPGKFEGEPIFVPALWDIVLNGFADNEYYSTDDDITVSAIEIDDELRAAWPELKDVRVVELYEDDNGFVRSVIDGPDYIAGTRRSEG
jgi:hypothetical protein